MFNVPRAEYPRPQFERKNWKNLNGEWDFCFDNGRSGKERKIYRDKNSFDKKITVPFCVESELSGIGEKDFIYGVWYHKEIELTASQISGKTILNIGAADYKTYLFINEMEVGSHEGGYVSFNFDISDYVREGNNTIVIYCEDNTRSSMIPRGKQSEEFYSHGCDYTRTTGIWQTVWLEFMPKSHVDRVKYFPDIYSCSVTVEATLSGTGTLKTDVFYAEKNVGSSEIANASGIVTFNIPLQEKHLWEVGCGRLYDVKFTFGDDEVSSYFGLRNIRFEGFKFMLNDKSVFQRLVLDQGFYPDGICTAPTDDALHNDIILSKNVGFNGARLHQKVFEERFLYHCDKEGYLVWGEYPNWGLDHTKPESIYHFLPEWLEEVKRDFNHPSIIGWCPFNETWDINGSRQYSPLLSLVFQATKSADSTRPCIDTSGNYHVKTDIFDVHDYEQNPEEFAKHFEKFIEKDEFDNHCNNRQKYIKGMPMFVSEYGGIRWSVSDKGDSAWGYGNAPKTGEEYIERYKGLTDILLDNEKMFGFCYTQLTDVEQEQNGIYTYYREEKFDSEIFKNINSRIAAIELK